MKTLTMIGACMGIVLSVLYAQTFISKKQLPGGAVLSVKYERYKTNDNMCVLEQIIMLRHTNEQSKILWRDAMIRDEQSLDFIYRIWSTIHDLYYDEEKGIFIMTSDRSHPITVTMVKVPPYPGRHPITPNETNISLNDYEYLLKAGKNMFFDDNIRSAKVSKTNDVYYINVEVHSGIEGRPNIFTYRRTDKGWEQISPPLLKIKEALRPDMQK